MRDPRIFRLARCTSNESKERNLRRNLHSLVGRTGGMLPVKIDHVPVRVRVIKRGRVKVQTLQWPMLQLTDWLKCGLAQASPLFLGGFHIHEESSWRQLFFQFWQDYKSIDPGHPIYQGERDLGRFWPFTLHGDEGRGKNRVPIMLENYCPIIPRTGIQDTNLKGHFGRIRS